MGICFVKAMLNFVTFGDCFASLPVHIKHGYLGATESKSAWTTNDFERAVTTVGQLLLKQVI